MSSLWRRTSAPEGGFTLMELVVTMALMALVVTSMVTLFSSIQRTTIRQEQRGATTEEIRLAMDRITKDARQAEGFRSGSSASVLDMDTYVNGIATRVIYTASGATLTRTVGSATRTLLARLSSTSLFTYAPSVASPTLVRVTIQAGTSAVAGTATVSLTSDVRLRNR